MAEKRHSTLDLPADLELYLAPDLWRKLSRGTPQRGALIQAQDRLRSLRYLLSTFIPSNLVQEKMQRPVPGLVRGEMLTGSLLFSDVSGFTALSERLSVLGPEGAERLTATMNDYFATMLEILAWSGGILLKFAGDAMLVYFPAQENDQQAQWAVRVGVRMLASMPKFSHIETPLETISLKMKVGIATGQFLSASIGSRQRMEYAVLGEAISQTMGAEGAATGPGQLVINQTTANCLDESFALQKQVPGYFLVDMENFAEPGNYEIKAEKRRARGAIPFDASPEAIIAQMQDTLDQIHALRPYIADELVERIVAQAQRLRFDSEFLAPTVLFCNFDGLETLLDLWGKQGASRVTNLLSAYFIAISDVINRYGGIISRIDPYSKGTKLLALFGAPVSHQDDPLRAVRAALMMNTELENLNQRWSQKFARHLPDDWQGPLIQHRIGITTGETFAGPVGSSTRREYTVMGDDVNLSARLMGVAKMRQILISQPVYQAVNHYFFHTELTPIKVKGKSQPISIYQVDGPRTNTLLNRVRERGNLVGRTDELAQAEKLLQQALSGTCTALTIQGLAGIGKSHLADTLLQQALSQGVEVLSYQCNAYNAQISYACWSGIVRSLAGITSTDPLYLHNEKFQRLLTRLNIADQHAEPLANLIGLDYSAQSRETLTTETPPANMGAADDSLLENISRPKSSRRRGSSLDLLGQLEKRQNFETSQIGFRVPTRLTSAEQELLLHALTRLLSQLLTKSPVVLFFEDADWMDEASRSVLPRLQKLLGTAPLMFILAQRSEQEQPVSKLAVWETITLGPLDNVATSQLVADVLTSNLAEIVHQHSHGSPLFIRQIAYWIQQTWQISTTDVINALQTSDILQNLVLSSLDSLPENQRQIARISSVIGEEFRAGELQALLPTSIDTVTLYNDLRALVEARFITLVEAGVDPRYAFQQKLVRDVLYNSLPFARRRELHAKMAKYLSSAPSQRSQIHSKISAFLDVGASSNPAQDALIIAHHYEAAEKWDLAAKSLLTAAEHLEEQVAYAEAIKTYQRALDDLDQYPAGEKHNSLKITLTVGKGDSAFWVEDYALAAQNYQMALAMEDQAVLKRKLALILPLQGKAIEARQLLEEQEETLETEQSLATVATQTWLLWRSDDEAAVGWIEKCLSLLPSHLNDWSRGVAALLHDFGAHWEDAISTYQAIDQPVGVGLATIRLGDKYLHAGDEAEALERYLAATEMWNSLPEGEREPALALAYFRQAEANWRMKNGELARTCLNEAHDLLEVCPASIGEEGRKLVASSLEMINTQNKKPWPTWRWQVYDDLFRIKLLFKK